MGLCLLDGLWLFDTALSLRACCCCHRVFRAVPSAGPLSSAVVSSAVVMEDNSSAELSSSALSVVVEQFACKHKPIFQPNGSLHTGNRLSNHFVFRFAQRCEFFVERFIFCKTLAQHHLPGFFFFLYLLFRLTFYRFRFSLSWFSLNRLF